MGFRTGVRFSSSPPKKYTISFDMVYFFNGRESNSERFVRSKTIRWIVLQHKHHLAVPNFQSEAAGIGWQVISSRQLGSMILRVNSERIELRKVCTQKNSPVDCFSCKDKLRVPKVRNEVKCFGSELINQASGLMILRVDYAPLESSVLHLSPISLIQ